MRQCNWSSSFQPLSTTDSTVRTGGAARFMPRLAGSSTPCVSSGLWRAYAGAGEPPGGKPDPSTTRARVAAAVESLLAAHEAAGQRARLVLAGHATGGALATLCAYDLLTSSAAARRVGVTLASFGSTLCFNRAFRRSIDELRGAGLLAAMRVVVSGDVLPRTLACVLPASGGVHAVAPRLLLKPRERDATRGASFTAEAPPTDADLRFARPDAVQHTCHAALLAGEPPHRLPKGKRAFATVAIDAIWEARSVPPGVKT